MNRKKKQYTSSIKTNMIVETRNHFLKEIAQRDLMSRKHRKVCMALNFIEQRRISVFAITGCVLISAFASLVGISIGIATSAVGLKICVISTGFKSYKSIIDKKKKMA